MPPKKAPGQDLAPAQTTALAASRTEFLASVAGAGMQNVGMADLIMPMMKVLQALSPAVNRRKAEYIDGAEPGMILNVATGRLFRAIRVVPCAYVRHHIEWKPNRGGFVKDHGENELIMQDVVKRDDKNFDILRNGNIIIPTPTWYALGLQGLPITVADVDKAEEGDWVSMGGDLSVIPMPRTMSKASRFWMSRATSEKLTHEGAEFTPPLFFRRWQLSTVETGDEQNNWFIWQVKSGPSVVDTVDGKPDSQLILPEDTIAKAQRFAQMVVSGEARASAEHFEQDGDRGASGSGSQNGDERPM